MYIERPKEKTTRDWSYYAILVSCLCVLAQLYAIPRKMASLMEISNRVLMVVWIVFVGVALVRKLEQRFPAKLSGALGLLLCSLLAYVFAAVGNTSAVVSNGLKLLGFLVLPMMLLYSVVYQIDAKARVVVLLFNIAASLIFIQLYNSDRRCVFEGPYGEVQLDVVTLGYPNANQTAMYLFLCIVSLVVGVFYFKSVFLKVVFAADAACLTWFLQQTGARAAILALIAFLVLSWFTGRHEMSNVWVIAALFIPILYVLILPLASNITVLGESMFNGRETVFGRYFSQLNVGTFLVGDMNQFKFENLHNGYVAIAASVGVPACISYIHLMKTCLQSNRPKYGAPTFERVAFVGFLCAVMYTSAEAAFFVGGSTYAMLVFSVCVLFVKARFVQVDTEVQP